MPSTYFTPFVPDATNPFDRRKAAHLLRRAGFGATPDEIGRAVEQGLEATVEELFADTAEEDAASEKLFQATSGRLINFSDIGQCQAWWVNRMLTTRVPLREKLTLFWHGHFATSHHKVEDSQLMLNQIETIRKHAWGRFHDLLLAMAKDPAMLVWLDSESNTKEHPNENFARELFELFTCGIGNYTEKDVTEAARAFTGWHRDGTAFAFNAEAHDSGSKKILGRTGKFDGGDVTEIVMALPATARFLARKLLRFFATPVPDDAAVEDAAELLVRSQFSIKWFLKDLFQSAFFHSDACYRQRVASPAEFVVGTVHMLSVRQPAVDLVDAMNRMGQELLAPPNVKGWDGEQKWINSSSLAARAEFAKNISDLNDDRELGPNCPIEQFVPTDIKVPREIVDKLAELLFQGELAEETRAAMADFLIRNEEGPQPDAFRDDDGFRENKTRNLLAVMLSLPEYQAY